MSEQRDTDKRGPGRPRKTEGESIEVEQDIITLTEHTVLITRDPMTKIAKKVYDHELPAIRFVHSADNVEVIDSQPVKVAGFAPEAEYGRLQRKYDRKNFKVVVPIYGHDASKIASLTGTRLGGMQSAGIPMSSQRKHTPDKPVVRDHS